jgi:hypothetical protein
MNTKDLINSFYQPLGNLKCSVSSGEMWEYAKARAIEYCDAVISELEKLHKPEYTTFIVKYPSMVDGKLTPAETSDGYERIDFYTDLKKEILVS